MAKQPSIKRPRRDLKSERDTKRTITLRIDGQTVGEFSELTVRTGTGEYQDGNDLILRKRSGRMKLGEITLRKGYIVSPSFDRLWRETPDAPTGTAPDDVELLVGDGRSVHRVKLHGARSLKKLGRRPGGRVPLAEITLTLDALDLD